jgi:hypothetical protein
MVTLRESLTLYRLWRNPFASVVESFETEQQHRKIVDTYTPLAVVRADPGQPFMSQV